MTPETKQKIEQKIREIVPELQVNKEINLEAILVVIKRKSPENIHYVYIMCEWYYLQPLSSQPYEVWELLEKILL